MERIQGLKEYVQTAQYLEGIGIGKEQQRRCRSPISHLRRENITSITGLYIR